jgi:FkbM family methyltransferase
VRIASGIVRASRRLLGRGPELTTSRRGLRWRLDLREGIDFSIYLLGTFEPLTVRCYERVVKPGASVLDVGANIGAHTLRFAQLVGTTGRVVAVEPTRFAFDKLLANVALNPDLAPRIQALQRMLVAEPSEGLAPAIYSSWPLVESGPLHAEHRGRLMNTTGAAAATLDATIHELGIQHADLIKLDVDGNELAVLRGAATTLARDAPDIVIELAPSLLAARPEEFGVLLGLLWDAGYRLRRLLSGRELPRNAAAIRALIPHAGSINALATQRA